MRGTILVSTAGQGVLRIDGEVVEPDPERREAWLRDQYRHPEEHRHTIAEVQRWFAEQLHGSEGGEAREYLKRRGIGAATADRFGIGFYYTSFSRDLRNILTSIDQPEPPKSGRATPDRPFLSRQPRPSGVPLG